MRNTGVFLLLLGATSFVFPLFHRRSMILGVFGDYEKFVAIASLVAGAVLLALSFRKKKEEEKK